MDKTAKWCPHEITLISTVAYPNPLYEVVEFFAKFTSPTGRTRRTNGFWNGGTDWRIRFMPDEVGTWQYITTCSDQSNRGLHSQQGQFVCEENTDMHSIFQHGAIIYCKGEYHLRHADGTPFLWVGCTAWNGLLKSTDEEWDTYLKHRSEHHYSVIQCVATQWRGADMNSHLQVAFIGQEPIEINPAFFQHLDQKINKINQYGLVAALVLLWALPYGEGRSLSPGFQLAQQEAVLLAKYLVARYGAHHVIWLPGGDGLYTHIYENRWKNIGQAVFGEEHAGVVALHPMGRSWVGDTYAEENWVDVIGYQSGHSAEKPVVEYITRGPAIRGWKKLPPRPIINMEPCYEEIFHRITAKEVRNAAYWSLFSTPVAGITYGANGIWPWIREGETILNHGELSRQSVSTWRDSLDLPGSKQVSYLSEFMQQFAWWKLFPDTSLLLDQPGDRDYTQFISIVRSENYQTILAYIPKPDNEVKLKNSQRLTYRACWYNPVTGTSIEDFTLPTTETISVKSLKAEALMLVLQSITEE
ncbi:MAG: DUF4038 domain-containing protein [Cyclobacteriaceae bacterium]